jgi:glycosyltransferase involved in cell wall biosynthesis
MPKISVLIPVYNAGQLVTETLRSIQRQTFSDFEVVLVDDGSTDDSIGIAKATLPRLVVVRQDHRGIAEALNNGLTHCRGQYIARIDCGDIAYRDRLSLQSTALDRWADHGVIGGHMKLFDAHGNELGTFRFPTTSAETEQELMYGHSSISHTGAMIRKNTLTLVGGYDPFYSGREDFELWTRVSLVAKISNLDVFVGAYLSVPGGLSFSGSLLSPLVDLALIERAERKKNGLDWKNEELRRRYKALVDKRTQLLRDGSQVSRLHAVFYSKRAGIFRNSLERANSLREYCRAIRSDPLYYWPWIGIISLLIPSTIYTKLVRFAKRLLNRYRGFD